jgi:hypothetical protein
MSESGSQTVSVIGSRGALEGGGAVGVIGRLDGAAVESGAGCDVDAGGWAVGVA